MAVTTKKTFNAVGSGGQSSTTVFTPVSIELNNQNDLDVYVTLSGGTRILQLNQSTGSTIDSNHKQVNDTTGLYFPAQSVGTQLYNYTISSDNNTITFNSALPTGAVVSIERRTRDSSGDYTNFANGSTLRAKDLNSAFDESNFTAQEARNKAFTLEKQLFNKTVDSTFANDSDSIPTGSAINTYVLNLLNTLGGFVAINDEVSFPNTNPDPSDDAGTAVSITDAGGVVVNSSGVSTTGRTLGGATVTINGFPTALRSKTLPVGMGLIVQTTSTLNTYTYHKGVATDEDIITFNETLASFNEKYSTASNDPGSGTEGDLFFNTTSNVMKVYNGSTWEVVHPTGTQLTNIGIIAGELGWTSDFGLVTENTSTVTTGNINTVADSIADINRYAEEYKIQGSAPSGPSAGDLWYDTGNNKLKVYNNSAWTEVGVGGTGNFTVDQSAKTTGSLVYYDGSEFKADTTTTKSTIVHGGSF